MSTLKKTDDKVSRLKTAVQKTPVASAVKSANEAMNCTKQGCGSSWS